jgi:hypothetical protein
MRGLWFKLQNLLTIFHAMHYLWNTTSPGCKYLEMCHRWIPDRWCTALPPKLQSMLETQWWDVLPYMRSKSSIDFFEPSFRLKMWMSCGNDWWIRTFLSTIIIAGWSLESSRHYNYSNSHSGRHNIGGHLPAVYIF